MDDRLGSLERKVEDLTGALAQVQERLARIEAEAGGILRARRGAAPVLAASGADAQGTAEAEAVTILALIGRTCLVLGGAYLLRALTDAGTLPRTGGTLLGVAYAVAWLGLAAWYDLARSRLVPAFYGAAAVLIAFPLLFEATVTFHLLTPVAAALSMTAITGVALGIAWRRRLQSLAWTITVAGLVAAPLFMVVFGPAVPFGFYLAFLGVLTLWMGYSLDWIWLRWPAAFVLDLTVAATAPTATEIWQRQNVAAVMALQLGVFGAYLVTVAARTIWRSRDVIPFEVVQMLALLVVGFGGAAYVMVSTGTGATALGVASVAFGFGSYGVALAFVDWRRGHWKNFVFYTSLGLVFIVAGTALTLPAPAQAVTWAALAVASAALGHRYNTIALSPHCAIYIVAAGIVSGLLGQTSDAFLASSGEAWRAFTWPAAIALAAAAASCAIRVPAVPAALQAYARLPKVVVAVTLLLGMGAVAIGLAVPLVAGRPGAGADVAGVACVRTLVLAAAALVLAWLGGHAVFVEGRWLTYVVLVIGGLKLLLSDFLNGRPATLFLSLAFYGAALILAPKWVRWARTRSRPAAVAPPPVQPA